MAVSIFRARPGEDERVSLNLLGIGHFHPGNEITNQFLEDLDIGTNDEWILERTGIRSRRTALPLDYIRETRNSEPRAAIEAAEYSIAEMGAKAAEMALQRAGVTAADVGLLVGGGCSPDTVSPAEACNIARVLGAESACLDVNSACTSFLAGVYMLSMMDPAKLPPVVLLICAEAMTRTVDYTDRSASVLWGDGSLAAVFSTKEKGRAEIIGQTLTTDPKGAGKVTVPRLGFFEQEGRTVQTFAIRKTTDLYLRHREEFSDEERRLNFVGHQANLRMLDSVCRRAEIPADLHHSNCEFFGNTGGASSGSVISQNWDKWTSPDDISVVGVGSGLTWASYLMRFF
ncbi:MAG: ketoacyl-ACP synthase III [Deltaproteobacteria bacterium]|nr:ketoacyl-ACP synthase III [Deltaproteobacteria bacterium]